MIIPLFIYRVLNHPRWCRISSINSMFVSGMVHMPSAKLFVSPGVCWASQPFKRQASQGTLQRVYPMGCWSVNKRGGPLCFDGSLMWLISSDKNKQTFWGLESNNKNWTKMLKKRGSPLSFFWTLWSRMKACHVMQLVVNRWSSLLNLPALRSKANSSVEAEMFFLFTSMISLKNPPGKLPNDMFLTTRSIWVGSTILVWTMVMVGKCWWKKEFSQWKSIDPTSLMDRAWITDSKYFQTL